MYIKLMTTRIFGTNRPSYIPLPPKKITEKLIRLTTLYNVYNNRFTLCFDSRSMYNDTGDKILAAKA